MALEKAFVRSRFNIVKQQPEEVSSRIERPDKIRLQRKYRLPGKILDEIEEGQVQEALQQRRAGQVENVDIFFDDDEGANGTGAAVEALADLDDLKARVELLKDV